MHYLIDYKKHRTILIEGARGDGKSWTLWALVCMARQFDLTACYAATPDQVRIRNILVIDDPKTFYKRDFMKAENKERAKALQRARGAIELLILTVPSIARLDIDIREEYSVHGSVLKHGWLEIEGVVCGAFIPDKILPDDSKARKREFTDSWQEL